MEFHLVILNPKSSHFKIKTPDPKSSSKTCKLWLFKLCRSILECLISLTCHNNFKTVKKNIFYLEIIHAYINF